MARRRATPLVRHPLVRGVTFTGSVPTGRAIMAMAAERTIPVVLELGGKNAVLVFADADLDRWSSDLIDGAFGNSGQVCSAASKLLVEDEHRRRVGRATARARGGITVGAGRDDPDLGPVVSEEQHEQGVGTSPSAHRDSARLATAAPARRPAPRLVRRPTIFDHVDPRPGSPARRCSAPS